jgi:hypothetical protein
MPDGRRFGIAIALAEDDIVNPGRVNAGSRHQSFQDDSTQFACIEAGEAA